LNDGLRQLGLHLKKPPVRGVGFFYSIFTPRSV
jgi:hypothetical protein